MLCCVLLAARLCSTGLRCFSLLAFIQIEMLSHSSLRVFRIERACMTHFYNSSLANLSLAKTKNANDENRPFSSIHPIGGSFSPCVPAMVSLISRIDRSRGRRKSSEQVMNDDDGGRTFCVL